MDSRPMLLCLLAAGALILFATGGTQFAPPPIAPAVPRIPIPAPSPTVRTLLVFTTSGCSPCAKLKTALADPEVQNALTAGGWNLQEVTSKVRAKTYRVSGYPTTIAEVAGQEKGRRSGYMAPAELAAWIRTLAPAKASYIGAVVAGPKHSDGTEVAVDLPGDLHQKNIAAKGLGCCVFRSLDHASRWQNVPALDHMPEWMVKSGIAGGGYPAKVDKLIPQIAKDRGLPTPGYIQIENADHEALMLACKTGRMVCATYSRSPTGRYGGSRIAHMVNVVHADANWVVVLDNNYIGETNYEWMTPAEAKKAGVYEWIVVLLDPPPPPPPINPPGPLQADPMYARKEI